MRGLGRSRKRVLLVLKRLQDVEPRRSARGKHGREDADQDRRQDELDVL